MGGGGTIRPGRKAGVPEYDLGKVAIEYTQLGFSVIPLHTVIDGKCTCGSPRCSAPGKHPRIKWRGKTRVALSEKDVRDFWERNPESNIGIVTGNISGITVLDIDGEEGLKSLQDAGLPVEELPLTPMVKTGGGGLHLFFRCPERIKVRTRAGVLPNVDIRSEGGMVVAPPSLHKFGNRYEWVQGRTLDDLDPADFDFSLLTGEERKEAPKESDKGKRWYEVYLQGVGEGERNNAAARLAGRYFGMGMTKQEVTHLLRAWNLNNNPPIAKSELDKVINSIHLREKESAGTDDLIENISNILGLKLNHVKRITGDEPEYILEFDQGNCHIKTNQLLSPKGFQEAVCEATKVVIRRLSTKTTPTHDQLAQMVASVSEDVDAGLEATGAGELTVLLRDYLASQRMIPETEEIPPQGSFKRDGLIWVSLVDLVQRSSTRWGMRTSIKQMAQRLRGLGIERRTFNTEHSQRIMWGIDPKRIDWEGGNIGSHEEEEA